jgi:hypothetical protein
MAAVGILVALTAAGAAVGYSVSPPPPANKTVGAVEGGTLAALATGFGGLLVGAASPRWRGVGEMTGLVAVGAVLTIATLGAFKPVQKPAQLPAGAPGTIAAPPTVQT